MTALYFNLINMLTYSFLSLHDDSNLVLWIFMLYKQCLKCIWVTCSHTLMTNWNTIKTYCKHLAFMITWAKVEIHIACISIFLCIIPGPAAMRYMARQRHRLVRLTCCVCVLVFLTSLVWMHRVADRDVGGELICCHNTHLIELALVCEIGEGLGWGRDFWIVKNCSTFHG